jgi:hypothetical protein
VPLFQRRLGASAKVKEMARSLRTKGELLDGYADLLRDMNRCKPAAETFDLLSSCSENSPGWGERW